MRENWHSLREYQALRALMESGTTVSAARRLGLSQSAISRSLSNLEARSGHTLFNRNGGRLEPTAEAIRMNANLDDLFRALDQIDRPAAPVKETLLLIAPPTYAHRLLVPHIAVFSRMNPNFLISLEVGTADEVVSSIVDRRFDLGVTGVELSRAGLKLLPLRKASAVCVLHPDHPLASNDRITPSDLNQQKIIALTSRHMRRAQLEKVTHDVGAKIEIVAEVGTSVAAIELARTGLGIAIVNPFPAVVRPTEDLVVRKFISPINYRTYFAVSDHAPVSRVARAFMRHVRTHVRDDAYSERI